MSERTSDWNTQIIEEFRANEGRVGGPFEGGTLLLLHHRGRKSGAEYVAPLAYQSDAQDHDVMYIFGSAAGAPTNPQWYDNILASGDADVEVGTDTFRVTAEDVSGAERDRIYAAQVQVMPGFADYEKKTAGIRTIPVVRLRRAA